MNQNRYRVVIGRKKDNNAHYIGRGSILGNPYRMLNNSLAERNRVCDLYNIYFNEKIKNKNKEFLDELSFLENKLKKESFLVLGCFCSPKRCHGETIKNYLLAKLNTKNDKRLF